jgi:hypothetical protein
MLCDAVRLSRTTLVLLVELLDGVGAAGDLRRARGGHADTMAQSMQLEASGLRDGQRANRPS